MLFNSIAFAIFLPVVFAIYWLVPHKFRWPLLLIASYYFYMSWNPKYVVLILITTITSFFSAKLIARQQNIIIKKIILIFTCVICLGVLLFFKYFNFISESVVTLLNAISLPISPITLNILLPVGISFYTFQTLSYVIDVYRGGEPENNLGVYATFISFFPQLVAGPIERTGNLLPQIKSEKSFNYDTASYGLKLMAWGFFKKLAIADVTAKYVDAAYNSLLTCTGFDLLIAIFFFTIQIYCDFSGYSDIAIGTAKLLGINLMTNFKSPYLSKSIKEFWSRWHISLSTWFRDYVYIPLGGNRCSKIKRDRNLIITFLISGLWHGANWTFVIWGGIHGIAQVLENRFVCANKKFSKPVNIIKLLTVFAFCNLAWVFFRAQTLNDAIFVIETIIMDLKTPSLFLYNTLGLEKINLVFILFSILVLFIYDYLSLSRDVIKWISSKGIVLRWIIYLMLIWSILFYMPPSGTSEFVYFQF